jgi:putative restriction endonuclease
MTRDEILAAFDRIRVWQHGDRRAVHKPLLVLLELGRLLRGEAPLVEFAGIEGKLGNLLQEFGPSGSEKTPAESVLAFAHRRRLAACRAG